MSQVTNTSFIKFDSKSTNQVQHRQFCKWFEEDVIDFDSSRCTNIEYVHAFKGKQLGDIAEVKVKPAAAAKKTKIYYQFIECDDHVADTRLNAPVDDEKLTDFNIMDEAERMKYEKRRCKLHLRKATWLITLKEKDKEPAKLIEIGRCRMMNAQLRFITDAETMNGRQQLIIVKSIQPHDGKEKLQPVLFGLTSKQDVAKNV